MMEQKALACIAHHGLIEQGDTVIVALSGGADSVALFHFLLANREKLGISLGVAHFEHGLRGAESLENAAYVQRLCDAPGLPFFIDHGEMADREKPKGLGIEEWGRRLRYAFFDRIAAQQRAKIATAHTLTDNAETVLFNAIRGAGTRGIAGIPPKRGAYIRPLLWAERREIEDYCARHQLDYISDSYNFNLAYSRNRIRAQVMPLLEQAHPGAQRALARMAGDMGELDAWLTRLAEALLADAGMDEADSPLARRHAKAGCRLYRSDTLLAAPVPVRRKALALLVGRAADHAALARLEKLLRGETGAVQLPGGLLARAEQGRLVIGPPPSGCAAVEDYEIPLETGAFSLPGGYALRVETLPAGEIDVICEKSGTKSLTFVADYDKISRCSVFRRRRQGDRFSPPRRDVSKSLKKWMNEAGLDPALRHRLPLLCDGGRVLWIWDHGFCAGVQPDAGTKQLLVIRTDNGDTGGNNNGTAP